MKSVLDEAQGELTRDLAKAKGLGTDGKYTSQVHRNTLMQIKGALRSMEARLGEGMSDVLKSNGSAAGALATNHLVQEVTKFSTIFEGTVRPVAFDAARVIAEGNKTLWPRYKNSASRYAGQVGNDIRQQLAVGLIRGETVDQMTRRLANLGGPKGLVYTRGREGSPGARAEIISEGLFKRYNHWAERIVRTEVVNAYNEAALIGMSELEEDDPGYFKRWDAAVDGRLCVLCRSFDDLVVPLKEKFPLGFDKPPRHPRCRCAVVIWRKEWDEADVKDDLVSEVRKGKKLGSVASVPHKIQTPEAKKIKAIDTQKEERQQIKNERVAIRNQRLEDQERLRLERATKRLEKQKVKESARQNKAQTRAEQTAHQNAQIPQLRMDFSISRRSAIDPDFKALATKYGVSESFAKRLYTKDNALIERVEKRRAREQKQDELAAAREERADRRKLKSRVDDSAKEDIANMKAVEKMKRQPDATSIHERVQLSNKISERDLLAFKNGTEKSLGRSISMEEISHAFAPPEGYYAKIIRTNGVSVDIKYFDSKTHEEVANLTRSFWKDKELHHTFFQVDQKAQGSGFSDTINGQAMLRYEKWGVKVVSVEAAWVGRYAWARMGFNFGDEAKILSQAVGFIKKNVPVAKQAEYMAKAKELVKEPWKLAKWDEGDKYKVSFDANSHRQTDEYSIGKAIMLNKDMPIWDGQMDLKSSNKGYLNAMRLLKVSSRS